MALPIRCNIDRRMRGYLLLRQSPYMTKTNAAGKFAIRNVPVGEHRFRFWHERIGYLKNIRFGELVSDRRGTLTIPIRAGENRLPLATLEAKDFPHADKTK